jgi:uncharacterized GH25 family protein
MTIRNFVSLVAALGAAAAIVTAHATWIAPVQPVLEMGKPVTVQVGNGHHFPDSESAVSPEGLDVFAVGPGGDRARLTASVSGKTLTARHHVQGPGTYRFVFVQDRGVMSRTPAGLKPGGKDQHPNATQSMKAYRSAVAYATTAGAKQSDLKPVGLKFELAPQRSADTVTVTLLQDGKPCAGAAVNSFWPGKDEQKAGTTDTSGKFVYHVPAGQKGQFLLTASHTEKAPAGAVFDTLSYSTALYLTW